MKVENLKKYYGTKKGIEDVSFYLPAASVLGVLGHNGSGKSTLFKCLVGLISANSGTIDIGKQVISYLPENRALYQDVSVDVYLRFIASLHKLDRNTCEERISKWLAFFEIEENRYLKIQSLSKGNQQKIQLVSILLNDPDILILDEPMSGLDVNNMSLVKRLIHTLIDEGKRILLSSHQYDEVELFCELILVLDQGDVKLQGNIRQLKREFPWTYVSIGFDPDHRYQDEKGVLAVQREGNMTRYKLMSGDDCDCFVRKCMQERGMWAVKVESISLKDMVTMIL